MDSKNGIILWIMGGAGVFLLWSGITNRTNLGENLSGYLNNTSVPGATPKGEFVPGIGGEFPKVGTGGGGFSVEKDVTGTAYIVDRYGNQLEVIPDIYQSRPYSYVPKMVT